MIEPEIKLPDPVKPGDALRMLSLVLIGVCALVFVVALFNIPLVSGAVLFLIGPVVAAQFFLLGVVLYGQARNARMVSEILEKLKDDKNA